jgi:transcriptional regulator with XRE-family HTH domain
MARRTFNGGKARDLRENKNLNVAELADLIEETSGTRWHRDTLTNVELGHHQPSLKLSHAWAAALGVARSDLYYGGWDDIENLPDARRAWRNGGMVHVRIEHADGKVIDRLSTNAEDLARERAESALAETPDAVIVLTLASEGGDTP